MLAKEAAQRGLSFQNSVWFSYADKEGRGQAEVDHLLWNDETVWIFESKLSQAARGILQVEALYRPLVSHVYAPRRVVTIMVCQNLLSVPTRLVTTLDEVLASNLTQTLTWHWLGR